MRLSRYACSLLMAAAALVPIETAAQTVSITRGIFEGQPYTLVYPSAMLASGGGANPLTINHPDAPLQCELAILPATADDWTPQGALEHFDEEAAAERWAQIFPGFAITGSSVVPYQNGDALLYEGLSDDSPMDIPITLVHTEAVDAGRGYVLDCIYATAEAANARPIVDFIIANFSTRSDAECCAGAQPAEPPAADPPQ
ncbi:hypothetical protein [Devosia nitrariae]|uniref:Uncharacterized protein n=1 Tax=Devosia nitrariae TaxID=2071872 RepID=A0ABQ5WBA0_9HYPH|nr:hypothetical protein [Devosia nitrariae]GLQ57392.1 hypothetical protein GCM10010862_46510 [Devosia nitrariae]